MSTFKYRICDPREPEIRDRGTLSADELVETFKRFPWSDYLAMIEESELDEIHFSPSIEYETEDGQRELSISAVGDPEAPIFYAFYRRPKPKSYLFGLIRFTDQTFVSDLVDQSGADIVRHIEAFAEGDREYLETVF